ncbi:MAG: response regulator transcription factor [Chloroflexi bacterium]|nr:response regulator transcription factor [Chloroflexota bacterium]
MNPIRILLVDDQVLFRKALASLINSQQGIMEVVGEAGDGQVALEAARNLQPDLILMDVRMPGVDGLEATRLIKEELPTTKIVMLTVSDEEGDVFEAIKLGAQGYLSKDLKPNQLFEFIKGAAEGEIAITPGIASKILQEFRQHPPRRAEPKKLPGLELTAREKEVLRLVAEGDTNKQIALTLFVAEGTVKNHFHNILVKLQLKNRAQAAAFALREGLVPLNPPEH